MSVKCEKTVYEVLPTGSYPAKVVDAETADGQFGTQVRLRFEITAGEHVGKTISGWATLRYSEKTKLYAWTKAILGYAPDSFDSDELLDVPCKIVITEVLTADGTVRYKVDSVQPVARTARPRPQARVPAVESADGDLF